MSIEVRDNPQEARYEIYVDGEQAGLLEYERNDGTLVLIHTEVDDAHQGQGLAAKLVAAALDAARQAQLPVRPDCPYVRTYLERHPDQLDLVPSAERARFGL
jgi:predicted GNAT family acetyltransferase